MVSKAFTNILTTIAVYFLWIIITAVNSILSYVLRKLFPSDELVSKIFENPHLVQRVLRNFDIMSNLDLRLVSCTFNKVSLGILRKENRDIKFDCLEDADDEKSMVYVNWKPIELRKAPLYFSFLNNIAGLKVKRIVVIDIWKLGVKHQNFPKQFHDDLLNKLIGNNRIHVKALIGLEFACRHCQKCLSISTCCREYGPMSGAIMNYKSGKHFERIIVTDCLLERIANTCVLETKSKEDCYALLTKILTDTNITCSTLLFCIDEARDASGTKFEVDHIPFPREVLEAMLEIWKVKSVELKIRFDFTYTPQGNYWAQSNYFTGVRLNDSFESVKFSENSMKFQHIHVDLTNSFYCARDLKHNEPEALKHRGFQNLIANIRRIFGANEISMKFSHWFYPVCPDKLLENLLNAAKMDFHQNLSIDIHFFAIPKNTNTFLNEETTPEGFGVQMLAKPVYRRSLKGTTPEVRTWIGQRCRYLDSEKNLRLDVNVYTMEEEIEKAAPLT